jgi:threonine synthase
VRAGTIDRKDRTIVISTAHGLKFTEFKTRYHAGALGFPVAHANSPVRLGAEPTEVLGRLHELLDARAAPSRPVRA